MPSWRVGTSATMASMTPGRKLSTGMDWRMSRMASMTPCQRLLCRRAGVAVAHGENQAEDVGRRHSNQRVESVEREGAGRARYFSGRRDCAKPIAADRGQAGHEGDQGGEDSDVDQERPAALFYERARESVECHDPVSQVQ